MKRFPLHAMQLGACLYVPATHQDLSAIAAGEKLTQVRSLIYCTEDSVHERDLPNALAALNEALSAIPTDTQRHHFIRLRRPELLPQILKMAQIERVHGFVLPKISASSLKHYQDLCGAPFQLMPTLETAETFLESAMLELLQDLEKHWRAQILCLRIGGNDLLNLLHLRRPPQHSIYATPLAAVIQRLVGIFKPHGYYLSAPVFEFLNRPDLLRQEVQEDLRHGLTGKTAIHPAQIPIIEAEYAISAQDYALAQRIIAEDVAIFRAQETMQEKSTHQRWAEDVIQAADFWFKKP